MTDFQPPSMGIPTRLLAQAGSATASQLPVLEQNARRVLARATARPLTPADFESMVRQGVRTRSWVGTHQPPSLAQTRHDLPLPALIPPAP